MESHHPKWGGKKFLKLLVSSAFFAGVTWVCINAVARKQVIANAVGRHHGAYTAFNGYLEKSKQQASASTEEPKKKASAHYWAALNEVRKLYPEYRVEIIVQPKTDSPATASAEIWEKLRSRPFGWLVADEAGGWARSFYVLPTKNTAALWISSDVSVELAGWKVPLALFSLYVFSMLAAYGWLWAQRESEAAERIVAAQREEVLKLVAGMQQTLGEFEAVLGDLRSNVAVLELRGPFPNGDAFKSLEDLIAQIRVLAVNGSIEAARSAESYRVFHALMQEINQHATQARETIKGFADKADSGAQALAAMSERIALLQARFSVAPKEACGQTSFRRVG